MIGVRGEPPHKRGNCFSVRTLNGVNLTTSELTKQQYRIVNFNLENLEALLSKGLTWPIRIFIKSPTVAIIHDTRIPDNWYQEQYCSTCCPLELLPEPQRLINHLQIERGEQIPHRNGSTSYDYTKRPDINKLT